MSKERRIECINGENNNRTTKIYFSYPEEMELSISITPRLRDREEAVRGLPLAELFICATGSTNAPWIQGHIFYRLSLEDTEELIKLLNEAKEEIKKHQDVQSKKDK